MPAFRHGASTASGSHRALLAGRREQDGRKTVAGIMLVLGVGVRRDVVVRHAVIRATLIVEIERKKLFIRGGDVDEGYLAPTLRPFLVAGPVEFRDGHAKADEIFGPFQVVGEGGRGRLGQDGHG